jgi:hypothetical protein
MNAVVPTAGTSGRVETWLARGMFALAGLYLLLVAGLIHRAQQPEVTDVELEVMSIGLAALWPVFLGEAFIGVLRRDRSRPLRPIFLRAVLVTLLPPFRMALIDPRSGMIWLPRLGWQTPGKELAARLERAFGGPMLLFAFLILPVLGLEYFRAEQVRSSEGLALALHLGVAVIWVAFAVEFILGSSAAPNLPKYLKAKWLDVAIVVLPMLEFALTRWVDAAPLARLLRLGRALSPEQIGGLQRAYRLRGLATKAWHAFLLLGGLGRLIGDVDKKRLTEVEATIAALEDELIALRKEAEELRAKVATRGQAPP